MVNVVRRDSASIVNLKTGKLGGLSYARQAAGMHLGVSMPAIDLPCALIEHKLYETSFIDMSRVDRGSRLVPSEGAGLGFPGAPELPNSE